MNNDTGTSLENAETDGGEMARRIAGFDWSTTPLGPMADWPQSLRIVVRIMLDSRYAMWLGWGPDFTFLYNDAYGRMTLGPKHPWALGRSAREVWSEIWDDIGPRAESVVTTGRATWDEGLLLYLERQGFPEETYHTFSYSAVPNDDGAIGGMLCVVTEETRRTIGERRLLTLRELATRTTAQSGSAEAACRVAADSISENPYDLPFALVYLLDADTRVARLAGATASLPAGSSVSPALVDLADMPPPDTGWPLATVLDTRRAEIVPGLGERFGELPAGAWPEPPHTGIVLPLARSGQDQLAGFVVAGLNPHRPYDDDYRGFLDLLAGQIATAITNARAYEEERRRAEALAELDRAKTTFFSNVSHEFRTPLTLMLGPVEDILSNPDGAAGDRQTLLQVVHRNGLRLQKLVNSLLDFARIEAGRIDAHYRPTDLSPFTADLASSFRSACERAGLELVVDVEPLDTPVHVDHDMWEKIVLNLLSNAFKYTLHGGIQVALRPGPAGAELSVRDSGSGIPDDQIPHLFERFHRVEGSRGRTQEGSGIGLALVRELVRLHGGEVRVESTVGQGSTFTVTVPFGTAHLPADRIMAGDGRFAAPGSAAAYVQEAMRWLPEVGNGMAGAIAGGDMVVGSGLQEGDRAHILLADDNSDMRDYVARLLSDRYTVTAVRNGAVALEIARAHHPDLVLGDVMMPELDGFGLLRELRGDPATAQIPVILISARAGEEARVEGLESGADDYVTKPFSARELMARIGGVLTLARSRSEALRREQELRQEMARILESMGESFVALDDQWRIMYVNANMERLNNMKREDMIGRNHWELFPDALGTPIEENYRHVMSTRTSARFETHYQPYDRWFEISVYPVDEGGLAIYVRDITESKQAQVLLRDADRHKDEFLATLAHELRNPLAPIRMGLEVMKIASDDPEVVAEIRDTMERQTHQLIRLVDDLLDISRITRGKLELRTGTIALPAIIESAVEATRPLIESLGHELVVTLPEQPIILEGDPTRLAQVFANLLNNAAKYTEQNGRIELEAEMRDSNLVVMVRDNGIGIPEHLREKIFDMFVQVDRSLERRFSGLGIGLTLVRRLVEMHGGSIAVRSDGLRTGSTFTVTLPVSTAQAVQQIADEADADTPATTSKRRILVVDDNEDAARTLALMLEALGNQIRIAYNGLDAVAMAEEFRPEVIVMDIGMPGLNGYEAATRIRGTEWGRGITLIALTGWGQEADKKRSQEAGFDHHLTKPTEPAVLEALLVEIGE